MKTGAAVSDGNEVAKMGLKIRIAIMTCLVAAAAFSASAAYKSIIPVRTLIPEEVYARFQGREEEAQFFLRPCDGYVAVYQGQKEKTPLSVTDIEMTNLRSTDRALIQKGIPVADQRELLSLLEDLGS